MSDTNGDAITAASARNATRDRWRLIVPAGLIVTFLLVAGAIVSCELTVRPPGRWQSCRIPLPDGSGAVYFETKGLTEHLRRIRFETEGFKGVIGFLPQSIGAQPAAKVFWFPAPDCGGPYLLLELGWEIRPHFLVDLQRGRTMAIVKIGERVYAGDIEYADYGGPLISEDADGNTAVYISDGPAVEEFTCELSTSKMKYMGRVYSDSLWGLQFAPAE